MMKNGPISHNVRRCVRCEDEAAQRPGNSVFALGQFCLNEVFVEYEIANPEKRDENGVHSGYAALVEKYGWR